MTQSYAERLFQQVAEAYLAFRREFYHDLAPDLATLPPEHDGVQQAQVAQTAEHFLNVLPRTLKALPMVGGLLEHLEAVADIHSLSSHERGALHNSAMLFLHGTQGGIRPWYAEWVADSAERLSHVNAAEYYLSYPWDGLLYFTPEELARYTDALHVGDERGVERAFATLAARLEQALRDPIGMQPQLAFTGPEGEDRAAVFHLKTEAALALAAFIIVGASRSTLSSAKPSLPVASALAPHPPEMDQLFASSAHHGGG